MRSERAQRALDVAVSSVGLVLLSPFLAGIAIVILLDGGPPVIFRQRRVGRFGRDFEMLKFRSMVVDAERTGGQLTVGNDRRITRVGRWLRRLKLDELPQLLNVVAGDMSLVGPRPEVRRYVELYTLDQRKVLDLRPGITDPASLEYYDESGVLARATDPERTYVAEIMPHKIAMNLAYASRASVRNDVSVIVRTVLHPLLTVATRPAVVRADRQ
jgi:lipopolysaccharide/colanic/teichoic acid biosynthesis glycosyltransferase